MAVGKSLKLRLVLEGIEVPVIGATVQFGVGQPAMAQIEIVPNSYVKQLLPRTVTHLFYFDDRESKPTRGNPDKRWKILFSGELANVTYVKDLASRTAVLTCQDCTSYWRAALKYFYNDIIFNAHQNMVGRFNNASGATGDIIFGSAAALISLIKKPCRSYPQMKGILGGVIRILEAIGGYHVGEHTHGLTDFFTAAQIRMHFYEQIGACAADDSFERLIKTTEFYKWMNQIVSQGNNMFSAMDVINAVLNVSFYNWISNPVAMYDGDYATKNPVKVSGVVKGAPADICAEVYTAMSILSARAKTDALPGPSQLPAEVTPVNYLLKAGLTNEMTALLRQAKEDVDAYNKELKEVRGTLSSAEVYGSGENRSWLVQNSDGSGYHAVNAKDMLTSVDHHRQNASNAYFEFLLRFGNGDKRFTRTRYDTTPTQRLLTVLLAPDIFMCAPPKCNVIFPEQYSRIEFSRQMLVEPTRYMVITPRVFLGEQLPQEIFGHLYHFAPMVNTVDGKSIDKVIRTKRFTLPHEIYSGPIPQLEWFSDIREYDPILQMGGASAIKKIHANQEAAEKEERGIADKMPYLQHVAEFNFARMRYANRSMQLPMQFTPNLVAGLPAVVIDRYAAWSPGGQEVMGEEHWLGVPRTITHRLSQTSASTSVMMAYVRGHTEDDSMFSSVVPQGKSKKPKSKTYKFKGTGYDLLNPPHGGSITAIKNSSTKKSFGSNVVSALEAAGVTDIEEVGEIQNPDKNVPPRKLYRVGTYDPRATSSNSNLMDEAYGGNVGVIRTTRFDITEVVVESDPVLFSAGSVPFEVQTRPPWFSPIYSNANIGKFYNDLIGVGSIMRPGLKYEAVLRQLRAAVSGTSTRFGIEPDQPRSGNPTVSTELSVETKDEDSVSSAVSDLARLYSLAKASMSGDRIDDMIHILTDRPIACMEEVLGSEDLEFDGNGVKVRGKTGFHSNAFGDVGDLKGLDDAMVPMLAEHGRKASGKPFTIDPRVDPRPARRAVVRAYRDALANDKKLLG